MIPAILLCIGAATFGLCFLVDRLIQRLRHKNAPPKPCVRQPKRAISIGIVLVFVGIAVSLFVGGALALVCGCLIVLMGAVLVGSYFLFSIHYDAEASPIEASRAQAITFTTKSVANRPSLRAAASPSCSMWAIPSSR